MQCHSPLRKAIEDVSCNPSANHVIHPSGPARASRTIQNCSSEFWVGMGTPTSRTRGASHSISYQDVSRSSDSVSVKLRNAQEASSTAKKLAQKERLQFFDANRPTKQSQHEARRQKRPSGRSTNQDDTVDATILSCVQRCS